MRTQIQKWGNSLAVRIPRNFSKRLHLHAGSAVDVDIEGEAMVLKKLKIDLQAMLDQITPENMHHGDFDDTPKGKEEW